jgi:hypothetical protein
MLDLGVCWVCWVYIVARFDSNGELGLKEVVHGAWHRSTRLVRLVPLEPAFEKADVRPSRVQAGARFLPSFLLSWRGGARRLQGHYVRVRHDAVLDAAAIFDILDRAPVGAGGGAVRPRCSDRESIRRVRRWRWRRRRRHRCGGGRTRRRRRRQHRRGGGLQVDVVVAAGVGGPGHLNWNVAGWPERLHVSRHEEQRDDRGEERGQLHCVDSVSAHMDDGASTRADRAASIHPHVDPSGGGRIGRTRLGRGGPVWRARGGHRFE